MISSKHYTLYTKIKITFLANHLAISIKSITFAAAISAKQKKAPVAELVDALDLGSSVSRRAGSSPVRRTKKALHIE